MAATTVPVKVFLADDSAMIRSRVTEMLVASDMMVIGEAVTPEDSTDGILATHPDVVVLDVQLAGGTGLQVLRAVRAADPTIAFVVLSNNACPAYRRRYLGEGARRFLDKSIEFDRLVSAVQQVSQANH